VEAEAVAVAELFGSPLILSTLRVDSFEQTVETVETGQTLEPEPTEVEAVEEAEAVEDVFTYSAE
jgi:hypothetical protein